MEMDVNLPSTSRPDLSGDLFEQPDDEDNAGSDGSMIDIFDIINEDSLDAPSVWDHDPDAPTVFLDNDPILEELPSEACPSDWNLDRQLTAIVEELPSAMETDDMDVEIPIPGPSTSRGLPARNNRKSVEERKLAESLAKLKADAANGSRNWGLYMQLKKDKLRYQVNVVSRVANVVSNIFEGVSIFVNGHTDPPALELRELIQMHGGEYHCYMEYGVTTYTIASSLASAKVDKTRKNEIFILPSWIIDCIAVGKRLPVDDYLLMPPEKEKNAPITNFFVRPGEKIQSRDENRALDARDPNFLQEFYARSRLHLISTLAQDMKDFMTSLREVGQINEDEWSLVPIPGSGSRSLSEPVVFHIDLDCFFVSVGLRDRPELKGKPVAITHSKGSASAPGFSEIASCSYAARRLGLKNGMLVREALKRCPGLICLPYQFEDYKTVSKTIYTLISSFSLEVRAVSCDEMYVNFTKSCQERGIRDPVLLADHIRARIKAETGCPASVGIGPNMLMARLSTRKAKPDGVHWTKQSDVLEFISREKIENLPGVGYATWGKLRERFGELETCRDLQSINRTELEEILGKKIGSHIYKQCRGEDDSLKDFLSTAERKSVSCDINYGIRFTQREELLNFLKTVAEELSRKLEMCRRATGAMTLKLMIRSADAPVETAKYLGHGKCDTVNKTTILKTPANCPERIFSEVVRLFDIISPHIPDLRGIGVHCGRLSPLDGSRKTVATVKRTFFEPRAGKNAPSEKKAKMEKRKENEYLEEFREPPKFRGASRPEAIRMELRAILLEEASENNVKLLTDFLQKSFEFGAFSSLRQYALVLSRFASSSDSDPRWFTAVHIILTTLDETIKMNHGGSFLEEELRENPYANGISLYCTCGNNLLCSCK